MTLLRKKQLIGKLAGTTISKVDADKGTEKMKGTAKMARRIGRMTLVSLILVLAFCLPATTVLAGAPPKNSYGALVDSGATLQPDGSQQAIGSSLVSLTSGGVAVTTYTVTILGTSTVAAGEVTGVYVTDGTNTWSATGSFGPSSAVACTGASAIPVDAANLTIRLTLAASSAGKTVGVELTSENSGSNQGLPTAGSLHNIYAPADTLSVTTNSPVASSAYAGENGVQMQVLQVDSDTGDNGSVEITSVTVDDLGTTGAGDIDFMYVHLDDDNNFGNGVLDSISTATWAGTSTAVDITPMAAAARTVTNGTSKYIWITYDLNAGIATGTTLQSSVTNIAVAASDNGASGTWNSNSFNTTAAPSDTLSVTLNTPVATGAGPGDLDVQLQYLQVDSDNVGDGQVEIATVTVDDLGTAAAGDIDNLKVHIDDNTNFGDGVLGTATVASWDGTSTAVDMTAIGAASRTVTNGTSKYIWVTYDVSASIIDGTTLQSSVVNIAVAGGDSGATGTWSSNSIVTSSGPSNSLANCSGCHEYPPVDAASRDASTGNFVGDHDKHATYTCATCHVAPATETSIDFAHRTGTLNMDDGNIGVGTDNGTYSKGTGFAQSNTPTTGTCSNVDCHSNAVTPQWGVGTTACDSCHALPPGTNAHAAHYAAKGWAADETNCTVCHPNNTTGHSDVTDGSVTVIAGLTPSGTSPAITCATTGTGCHNEKTTPAWNTTNIACTACHTAGGAAAGDPSSGLHATTNLTDHDGTLTGGTGLACEKCHTASPSNLHYNGTVNNGGTATFAWDTGNIPAGYDRTNDFCAAVCHSDGGTWNREWSGVADAAWAYANDAATTAVCGNCHGSFFTGWNIIGSTSHDNPDVDNDPDTLATSKGSHNECSSCHTWGHTNYTTATAHVNNFLEMNSTLGYSAGSCSTNCHTGQTLTMDANSGWTDATIAGDGVTCGGCHTGGVTPGSASGAHAAHGATAASVAANPSSIALCIECHGNDGTGASHNNGTVNFVGATYSTAVRNDLTGTCSTSSCHNQGADPSTAWNTTALACDDCHYYAASPTKTGNTAHAAPLSAAHGDHFDAGKVCTQCHGALPSDTTHINAATSNADKATALQDEAGIDFTDASAVTDYTWTDGSNTCSGGTNNGLGCHATGAPVWDTPFDGTTACTTCHTNTTNAQVNPTSGLHGVVPSISAEQHDDAFGVGGTCTSCHASIPQFTTHKDGTFAGGNGQTSTMGLAAFYTQTANDTGTCATTTCHLGESDAWAHKWMTPANYTSSTLSCTGCHGNLSSGWNTGVDHLTGEIATDHADDGTASNYGCESCHALQASTNVYPFTFGSADWAPLNAGNKHGNNLITMNDDGTGTISDWQRGTGGNSSKSMCLKCHTNWTDSAPQHWFVNTTWSAEEIVGDGISAGHGVGAACISCHDGFTQGVRRDVGLEFNLTRQHGTNAPASADCEKCHDESSGPDGIIQLKVWNSDNTTFTTATYSSADLSSANAHCLSCHDATRGVTIGGLSPPARSMANYTSSQVYKNHNFTTVTGAVVPQKDKAVSPHGNPSGNQLKATESSVTTAVGCLHCHPSHGSSVASKAATADATGAAITAKMLGGKPSELASVGYDYTNEGALSDPDLCWGCHDNKGVADYYGDTTTGHWNTGGVWKNPTFTYKTGKGGVLSVHVADKVDGGTASDSSAAIVCTTCHDVHGSPTVAQFYSPALKGKWLTSPYYEDRAPPSKTATTNGLYAWANADSSARSTNDQYAPRAAIETGTAWAPKEVGGGYGVVGTQNGAWGWFIDGNTFGMSAYQPYASGAVTQRYMGNFDATAANISTFGGLCMTACHSAANIESRTTWTGHNPVVPGFGGTDTATDLFNVNGTTNPATAAKVRNQMVGQGWYNNGGWGQDLFATGNGGERQGGDSGALDARTYSHNKAFSYGVNPTTAAVQSGYHQFPCAKCHTPHASVLPALMRTNCLNTARSSFEWRMAAEANNCHRVEDSAAGYIGAGDPYPGTGYPATHGGATNGGWNNVTPW